MVICTDGQQVARIKPPVPILRNWDDMMYMRLSICQLWPSVDIEAAYTNLAQIFVTLLDLFSFTLPCPCRTELKCCCLCVFPFRFLWTLVSSWMETAAIFTANLHRLLSEIAKARMILRWGLVSVLPEISSIYSSSSVASLAFRAHTSSSGLGSPGVACLILRLLYLSAHRLILCIKIPQLRFCLPALLPGLVD